MSYVSTKKTIEIWDDGKGECWVVEPADGHIRLSERDEEGVPSLIWVFYPAMIGPLCKALHEVAQNVLENTKEEDAD